MIDSKIIQGAYEKLEPILGGKYLKKRRQDLPSVYMPNGAIYIAESGWFLHYKSFYSDLTSGYVIPQHRSLDIDSERDFKLFELILKDSLEKKCK